MVPPSPCRAKDFSVVKRDGWFHCFYIINDTTAPFDSTERELGHAISRDLYNWTQLPTVVPVRWDGWDNAKIWAPSIIEKDGVYYMFYTGVTTTPGAYEFHQRIGLATSTDLMTWNRSDAPIFSCDQVPWTYCDPLTATGGEFRDAFVMPNPSGPGWWMYYNTRPASDSGTFVAGIATSAGDLTQWTDWKPLWITHTSYSGSALVESPHVFQHNGLWYLFFTGDGSQPLRWATGPDPAGEPETWTYRGTLNSMLGVDTHLWFASEKLADGLVDYLVFADFDRVDFRRIQWNEDGTFSLKPPDLLHVHDMHWSATSVIVGQPVEFTVQAVNTIGQRAHFTVSRRFADGSEAVVPNAAIGFPDSVSLVAPVTTFTWTAQACPHQLDRNSELVIRLDNMTAEAQPLWVLPEQSTPFTPINYRDGGRFEPPQSVLFSRGRGVEGFRALDGSPLGRLAMLVDLHAPTAVRVDLYDLSGRRVRNLADREFPAGASVIAWDGRDASGARSRPGVYFARFHSAEADYTIRLLLAR